MHIAYQLTRADYLKFQLGHQLTSRWAHAAILGLVAVIAAFQYEPADGAGALIAIPILWMVAWAAQLACICIGVFLIRSPSMFEPQTAAITQDAFVAESAAGTGTHALRTLVRVVERMECVAIYVASHMAYIIPYRAFESPAQRSDFVAALSGAVAESKVRQLVIDDDPQPGVDKLPLWHWMLKGLTAAWRVPQVAGKVLEPGQFLLIVAAWMMVAVAVGRLEVPGPAGFDERIWLASYWTMAAAAVLAWLLHRTAPDKTSGADVPRWLALWLLGSFPACLVALGYGAAMQREWLPATPPWEWGVVAVATAWSVGAAYAAARASLAAWRASLLAAGVMLIAVGHVAVFDGNPWYSVAPRGDERPKFELSQTTFEEQQAASQRAFGGIASQRPGVRDLYVVVFAPYADEDVFLRESTMVAKLMEERFDAQGRTIHLVNHATTSASHPWATPENLRRAIDAVAAKMDKQEDILLVYFTSHGARNGRLSTSHWPLKVGRIDPIVVGTALGSAGIRNRIIAVSACFSGTWIAPLASDGALVMTASDENNTSYGCGRRSELTFFGRAVFHEGLRATHSFEKAFAGAVPTIRQREEEAGKDDGFSNPQIRMGSAIRKPLEELQERLEREAGASKGS
jgi:hypothetical protein